MNMNWIPLHSYVEILLKTRLSCYLVCVKLLVYGGRVLTRGITEQPSSILQRVFLTFEGDILQELQLSDHDSISLVLLIPHMVTKALLQ